MIHQTYTARKAPKTPPGNHEMGPSTDAAHCLQPAHTIYMHSGGVGSAKCIFCPGDLHLWPLTTFKLRQDFCTLHLTAKFHYPTFNRSPLKTSTSLHYTMLMGKQWSFFGYGCTLWVDVSVLKWSGCDLEWGLCCFNCYCYYIWIQSTKLQEILWSI